MRGKIIVALVLSALLATSAITQTDRNTKPNPPAQVVGERLRKANRSPDGERNTSERAGPGFIFDAQGHPFGGVPGKYRTPILIVDTVRMSGDYYSLDLQSSFSRKEHSVSGTSVNTVFATITPILDDSTDNMRYYAHMVVDGGRRLILRANPDSIYVGGGEWEPLPDSSKVVVHIFVK